MTDKKYKTISGFIEAASIFAKHAKNGFDEDYFLSAEHDVLYGPSLPYHEVTDGKRLEALGWHWDEDVDCWAYFT